MTARIFVEESAIIDSAMSDDGEKTGSTSRGPAGGKLGGLVQVESIVQLALALPAGCFIGALLGTWGDHRFGTHWMVMVGIMLGAIGGFIQMFTYIARVSRRSSR